MDYDIVIIGAGAVGLAIAQHYADKSLKCLVVERNSTFGMETSSRNSEVIHAGIYYPAESLKSSLCIEGNNLLYQWCRKANVNHKKIGKYIIAGTQDELSKLENIYNNATAKGIREIRLLEKNEVNSREPNIKCTAAILSGTTGIIDTHSLMKSFYDYSADNGADFAFNHNFEGAEKDNDLYKVFISADGEVFSVQCRFLINCGGLNSDIIAEILGIDTEKEALKINYSKGCYFRINSYPNIASKLIYPIPPANSKSLGIHLTLDLNGGAKLGPDAEYIEKENLNYQIDTDLADKFYSAAAIYIKNLKKEMLSPDQSGIRPKLQKPEETFRDFVIRDEAANGLPGVINLIGIESPGLTSCLAIAKYLEQFIN